MHAWTLALLVLPLLAGCLATPPAAPANAGDALGAAAVASPAWGAPLGLEGTGCVEGGGHSVHPRMLNPLPEPWVPADVLDDVGPQVAYSEVPDPARPVPEKGHTIGNYHATLRCDAWRVNGEERTDLVLGFVGMKVERPEWSDDAPTHHYLVTVVATSDADVLEALHAGGIHAMEATAAWTDLPGDALRIQMSTGHNGDYDSLFKPKPFGERKATHVRLWFQKALDDGAYAPVAVDLLASGGEHLVADGQGYFSHSGTHHHDPLPGAYGHAAALMYRGFDATLAWGPPVEGVRLADAYDH